MKRAFISAIILSALFTILCTGCAANVADSGTIPPLHQADQSKEDTGYPYGLFLSKLSKDTDGEYIYPDNYAGTYMEYDNNGDGFYVFAVVGDDFSDYQYIKDAFPETEFRTAEYSYNYLLKVRDDYSKTAKNNSEKIYSIGIDTEANRVVVTVDKETLASKLEDGNSPIVFETGSPFYTM